MSENNINAVLEAWAYKRPVRIHLKEVPEPIICVIIAFGKTCSIEHFDLISVIEIDVHKEFAHLDISEAVQGKKVRNYSP